MARPIKYAKHSQRSRFTSSTMASFKNTTNSIGQSWTRRTMSGNVYRTKMHYSDSRTNSKVRQQLNESDNHMDTIFSHHRPQEKKT